MCAHDMVGHGGEPNVKFIWRRSPFYVFVLAQECLPRKKSFYHGSTLAKTSIARPPICLPALLLNDGIVLHFFD